MDVTISKGSVTGAVGMVGAVGKVGLEMDVMEILEEVMVINANLIQVCTPSPCITLLLILIKNVWLFKLYIKYLERGYLYFIGFTVFESSC